MCFYEYIKLNLCKIIISGNISFLDLLCLDDFSKGWSSCLSKHWFTYSKLQANTVLINTQQIHTVLVAHDFV